MRTALPGLLLALGIAGLPAPGAAQAAVVLVPESDGASDEVERARSGAIEALAEHGIRLLRPPEGPACGETDCAAAIAERTGADLVVLVLVETEGGGRVRVRLVAPTGAAREALAEVGDAGFAEAAAAAIEEALGAEAEHRSGFLMVRTRPPGAIVHIDGARAGESPLRRMVRAGEHTVRVTRGRDEPIERSVTVRPLEETAVDLDLEAPEEAERSPRETRTEPSPFNWIIGGALAIAGVVTLVSPLQTLATEGQCVELIEGVGCVERVSFGAQSGVLLGIGIAAIVAGVVVDVTAPLRVSVEVSATGGLLRLEGRL